MEIQMANSARNLLIGAAVLAATACGGGGGVIWRDHAGSVPLAQPLGNLQTSGFQKTFSVTGTLNAGGQPVPVTGSVQLAVSGYNTATTFNGQAALRNTTTINGTLYASGQTIPIAITRQSFVTSNHAPLGSQSTGQYCVVTSWAPLPASIDFAATAPYDESACYADSTMATPVGTDTIAYYTDYGTGSFNLTVSQVERLEEVAYSQQAFAGITYLEMGFLIDTSGGVTIKSFGLSATLDGMGMSLTACEIACWG
jgi:hypothetical protein